jgi:hypothetical protein
MAIRAPGTVCSCALGCVVVATLTGVTPTAQAEDAPTDVVVPISQSLCDDMKKHNVLKPGAPVDCGRLSLIKFAYVGFDGRVDGDGEIVVMDAAGENVLRIFARLRGMRFPIAKARLVNRYGGNDDASMADNNTSAFNARKVTGGNSPSLHAYGLAIDINPIQNPYVKRSGARLTFNPPAGIEYANRFNDRPGKKPRPGLAESIIDVFADEGFFIWGGYWDDPIDYQHFQVGRDLAERLAGLAPAQAQAAFAQQVERYRSCRRNMPPESGRAKCIATNGQPLN